MIAWSDLRRLGSLWRVRVLQGINDVRYGGTGELFRTVLLVMIFLGFMISLGYLFLRLFVRVLRVPFMGPFLMLQTLNLVFLSFFILLVFSCMVTSLATQYMSSDLESLFAAPVSGSLIYWVKWFEALFHSTWMVVLFGYPILVSYGWATDAPWYYYPVAGGVLFAFLVIPAGLGSFLVNAVLYWIPIKRVRAVLVGVGVVFGCLLVYVLRMVNPRLLFEPDFVAETFVTYLRTFEIGRWQGFPPFHAAHLISGIITPDYVNPWRHAGWLLGESLLAVVGLGWISQRWYPTSWLRTRDGRPRETGWLRIPWNSNWFRWMSGPYRALVRKETMVFLRETTQWSQLLVLLGIVIVHLANLVELPTTSELLQFIVFFFNILLIGFILTSICVRFVFPNISLEGNYFWILRTAPVSLYQLFVQKSLFFLVPIGLGGGVLIAVTNYVLPVSNQLWWSSVVLVGSMALTLTAGALAFGALFPKFEYEHFGEVVTSAGSIFFMISGMVYVSFMVAGPVLGVFWMTGRWEVGTTFSTHYVVTMGVASGGSMILTILLLWVASRALQSYEYSLV